MFRNVEATLGGKVRCFPVCVLEWSLTISLQSDPYIRVVTADSIKGRTEVVNNSEL